MIKSPVRRSHLGTGGGNDDQGTLVPLHQSAIDSVMKANTYSVL